MSEKLRNSCNWSKGQPGQRGVLPEGWFGRNLQDGVTSPGPASPSLVPRRPQPRPHHLCPFSTHLIPQASPASSRTAEARTLVSYIALFSAFSSAEWLGPGDQDPSEPRLGHTLMVGHITQLPEPQIFGSDHHSYWVIPRGFYQMGAPSELWFIQLESQGLLHEGAHLYLGRWVPSGEGT